MPATLIMRMVRPLFLIRICGIRSDRIGHFVADIAEHIGRGKIKSPRTFNVYFFQGPISNTQWELMAKRSSLHIFGNWLRYLNEWNRIIPGGRLHTMSTSLTGSRDVEGLWQRFDCSIPFLPSEDAACEDWLKSKGWTKGEPFVALLVRDSAYLKQTYSNFDWNNHSYRDSDIHTYLPAMESLAAKGVWVLRMGKTMGSPIESKSNRIIDYAFESEKSDLLDIWLFSNSAGVISTSSGLDILSAIYRIPSLCINVLPLSSIWSYTSTIWVPKKIRWVENRRSLSLSEHLENDFHHSLEYENAGIEIVDLSEDEIHVAVQEFWERTIGSFDESEADLKRQQLFWHNFSQWSEFHEHHQWIHMEARIGASWLKSMGAEFFK
jgi:putative glycosyltransferase (TIGR04372 family)